MRLRTLGLVSGAVALTLAAGPLATIFQGASPGAPVAFEPLALPTVVVGPLNDLPSLASQPFTPSFDELTSGETIITTPEQWRHVWRRLFAGEPLDPSLVDFDSEFVVLMGGGFMDSTVGFSITSVEQFEATFAGFDWFPGDAVEQKLAIVATTVFPGVQPDPDVVPPPFHHVAAVKIPRELEADILFHRAIVALP